MVRRVRIGMLLAGLWFTSTTGLVEAQSVLAARQVQGTANQAAATPAGRVELTVGTGWAGIWDDETNLGKGVPLAAGGSLTIADRLRIGADVDWTRHVRDSGYLRAESDALGVLARGTYLFRGRDAAVRPLAGAGIGLLRSSGTFDFDGSRSPWTLTLGVYDLHAGLRIAVSDRLAIRPEYRWRATVSTPSRPAGIEPPLLGMQALVHLDFALSR